MNDKPDVCKCGKGYASLYDNLCCFCREDLVSRAEAKKLGVRCRGNGLGLDQYYGHCQDASATPFVDYRTITHQLKGSENNAIR